MTSDFCPRERCANGMTRRRALGFVGAGLISLAMPKVARGSESGTIVVCKATTEMDRPYEQQTIAAWELEEFDIYPVPANGCPETCPAEEADVCADRCGEVDVTCGRFTSTFSCEACPNEAKTLTSRGTGSKKTAKKRKKRTAKG